MEATEGFLEKIRPPRIEDAGLEDCALPPESIHEAFLKAASAVRSRATSILSHSDDEPDATCVDDPWPRTGDSTDKLVGISAGTSPPGGCAGKKGSDVPEAAGDKVVAGPIDDEVERGDRVVGADVPKEGESCVDELQGLKIRGEKKKSEDGDDEKKSDDRPILTEGYI